MRGARGALSWPQGWMDRSTRAIVAKFRKRRGRAGRAGAAFGRTSRGPRRGGIPPVLARKGSEPGLSSVVPGRRSVERRYDLELGLKRRQVDSLKTERRPVTFRATDHLAIVHGVPVRLQPGRSALDPERLDDPCARRLTDRPGRQHVSDVERVLAPISIARGLLKQSPERFSDHFLQREDTKARASIVEPKDPGGDRSRRRQTRPNPRQSSGSGGVDQALPDPHMRPE